MRVVGADALQRISIKRPETQGAIGALYAVLSAASWPSREAMLAELGAIARPDEDGAIVITMPAVEVRLRANHAAGVILIESAEHVRPAKEKRK